MDDDTISEYFVRSLSEKIVRNSKSIQDIWFQDKIVPKLPS